jgi:hypothetical protein
MSGELIPVVVVVSLLIALLVVAAIFCRLGGDS